MVRGWHTQRPSDRDGRASADTEAPRDLQGRPCPPLRCPHGLLPSASTRPFVTPNTRPRIGVVNGGSPHRLAGSTLSVTWPCLTEPCVELRLWEPRVFGLLRGLAPRAFTPPARSRPPRAHAPRAPTPCVHAPRAFTPPARPLRVHAPPRVHAPLRVHAPRAFTPPRAHALCSRPPRVHVFVSPHHLGAGAGRVWDCGDVGHWGPASEGWECEGLAIAEEKTEAGGKAQ
jgi:hypothetical protein